MAQRDEDTIVVRLPKAVVVLTPDELLRLLRLDPDLWAKALHRGKALRRAEAARRRGAEAVAGETLDDLPY